jgi:hypothetical protein
MQWQQFLVDIFEWVASELEHALNGLTVEELNRMPCPGCNSIGWLTWHLTRTQDMAISAILGEEQLWVKDKWYARFNRTPDIKDTGVGHSLEEAVAFSSPGASTLFEYHRAVLGRTKHYIMSELSEAELDRNINNTANPAVTRVRTRLMRVINDNAQHVGQVAYVRGMLKGWGWLGR